MPTSPRFLLHAFPMEAALLDDAGRIVQANRRWREGEGELSGPAAAEGADYLSVCARATSLGSAPVTICQAIRGILQGETPPATTIDYPLDTSDDAPWSRTHIIPLEDAEARVLVAHEDISANTRLHGRIQAAEERLREALLAKEDLLSLVSHELRTPLTSVRGNASALLRYGETLSPDRRVGALQDIEADAERLQQVVENLLVMAYRDRGAAPLVEPVLIGPLINRAIASHAVRYPESVVETDIEAGLPPVNAHAPYVCQVLTNVLSNAAKYSPPGVPIRLEASRRDDVARISVRDRGIGVAYPYVDRVFEPFFRAPEASEYASGVGLGLAVSRQLMEAQGGSISLESDGSSGTTVALDLALAVNPLPAQR